MDRLNVHGRWEQVHQLEIQTLSSPASNPLTVADHDVEVRFVVAEVEKDLILIRRPWNLLYFDGDSRFGLRIIAQFLQGRSGLPLGPPNGYLFICSGRIRPRQTQQQYGTTHSSFHQYPPLNPSLHPPRHMGNIGPCLTQTIAQIRLRSMRLQGGKNWI